MEPTAGLLDVLATCKMALSLASQESKVDNGDRGGHRLSVFGLNIGYLNPCPEHTHTCNHTCMQHTDTILILKISAWKHHEEETFALVVYPKSTLKGGQKSGGFPTSRLHRKLAIHTRETT